jgi:hypothetical protein
MYAVVGRVKIKPGQEDATLSMIGEHGVACSGTCLGASIPTVAPSMAET